MLVVFWLVNRYSLFVYIEHNGDKSPKELVYSFYFNQQCKMYIYLF